MIGNELNNTETTTQKNESTQGTNRNIILIITIGIVLLMSIPMGLNHNNNKQFNSNLALADQCFVEDKLDGAIEYYTAALSYKQDGTIQEKLALSQKIYDSKNQYDIAISLYNIMSYLYAYNAFQKVIPEDSKRYSLAQNQMSECKRLYLESQFIAGNDFYLKADYSGAVKAMWAILAIDQGNEKAVELLSLYEIPLNKQESARKAKEALAQKQEAEAAKTNAKTEGVRIGMTQQQVIDSSWGRPKDINRTTTAYGVHEQWVYSGYNYLYFDDGILTTIQN